eukprot:gene33941-43849_t
MSRIGFIGMPPVSEPKKEVALSFKHIGIATIHPPDPILSNVSGYVAKGGITATLAGQVQNLSITGELLMEGVDVDPRDIGNAVGYVPQEDMLIGELSAREMLRNAALMKRNKNADLIEADVNRLLTAFGLDKVADNPIGTVFVRGLSGGQKKRVDIGTELIAAPSVLLLDEPTSGLDASIALEVLASIKDIVNASEGKLSIMLSIHQPNSRILELFDHILLLGGGGMLFFGTVPESINYFTSIGFCPPREYTPTDYFLQVSDSTFGTHVDFDFEGSFACSDICSRLMNFLDDLKRKGFLKVEKGVLEAMEDSERIMDSKAETEAYKAFSDDSAGSTSFWRQYSTLVKRDLVLAMKDPALYYLQFVLVTMFGLLVGAAFFKLKYDIDDKMNNIPGSLLWIVMMMAYIQVFKVYHLNRNNHRFRHERANNTYTVFSYFCAELTTTSVMLLSFSPGAAIAYFMMGFPNDAYPFMLFLFWMTALTAESMLNFITKFHPDATVCIVASQASLVILTVFGGGVFIPWDQTPHYWKWLQELSIFTQASRAAIVNVMNHIDYKCTLSGDACVGPTGAIFPCDARDSDGLGCYVKGRTVLYVLQGTAPSDDKWTSFGWLVLIFVCFRLSVLVMMYYPVDRIKYSMVAWMTSGMSDRVLKSLVAIRRIEGQLVSFIADFQHQNASSKVRMRSEASMKIRADQYRYDELFQHDSTDVGNIPNAISSRAFCLVWENLTLLLKKKGTKLIDNVSGTARSGRVLALMGPSGAGKTTMLNALGNRAPYADVTGKITFGKRSFTSSDLFYVPQFDEVNENFSVYEQIELVGLLKCRDREAMHNRLHKLLHILGLHTKLKTLCSELTGGELKRVSVGMGMISNPSVLFLDEPTTGLDSSAAFSIVEHMVELARSTNVVVIMTIHQPSDMVFDMLQDLCLLEGGRLAYFGPLLAAERYFSSIGYQCPMNTSLADYCLDLIYRPPPHSPNESWRDVFMQTQFSINMASLQQEVVNASKASNFATPPPEEIVRLKELIIFFAKYYSRDVGFYFLRIVFLVVVALFLGTLYLLLTPETEFLPLYAGAVFFNIWTILFSAVAATGLLARDRRQALEQIKNAVITPKTYCLAQFIVSIPFNFIASLIFQAIFHWLTNINPDGESFIYAVLITCGHMLLMEALMLTVVQVLRNAMLSVTFAMVLLGGLFLFSGFFIKVKDMPEWIGWVCYMMPTKYSFDGYLYEIFHSQKFDITGGGGMQMSGDDVLWLLFRQKDVQPWPMFGTLLAFIVLIRLFHYGALIFETYLYLSTSNTIRESPSSSPSVMKAQSSKAL